MFSTKFLAILLVSILAVRAQDSTSDSDAETATDSATETGTDVPAPSSTDGISTCILDCVGPAATKNGCSSFSDLSCICASAQFQADAGACLQAQCTPEEQATALALQSAECGAISATGTATSGGFSGSATGSATTAATSAAASGSASHSGSATGSTGTTPKPSSTAPSSSGGSSPAATTSTGAATKIVFGAEGLFAVGVALVGAAAGAGLVL